MGFWDFFKGRAKTLDGITAPTKVEVTGRILNSAEKKSPLTDFPGVLFGWQFLTRRTDDNGVDHWQHHVSLAFGHPLEIEVGGRVLLMPLEPTRIVAAPTGARQVLSRQLPDGYTKLVPVNALIYLDETVFRAGKDVRVRATVAPQGTRFVVDLAAEAAEISEVY